MLVKLALNRLQDRQADLEAIAAKMEKLNDARVSELVAINANPNLSRAGKVAAATPLTTAPELVALNEQARLLIAAMDEQKAVWRNSAVLLRSVAVPDLRAAPSALERWELLKDGAPKQESFAEEVAAATKRVQEYNLDSTLGAGVK